MRLLLFLNTLIYLIKQAVKKMIKYLLFTFIITASSFAQYTTPNTGVEWNLDSLVVYSGGVITGSYPDFTLNNKIYISSNDLVWITPGSTIQNTSDVSGFEVNGIFKSEGTADSIITFTSPTQDSTGFYDGIRFNENTMSNSSIISYTYIEFAAYGMRCIDASPVLTHSHTYKCGRGVQLTGSNSEISFSKIERSYEYGILVNLDSNPLIENNEICFNNTQGTSAKNQISIGLQGNNSPVIRNNTIYGGESIPTGGISLWVSGVGNFSNMIVEGDTIYNNSYGITLLSSSNGIINAMVRDNVIYNNNINPNALVSGSGININGSPENQPVITGNTLYGNWWGITIQNGTTVQAGPQPNIGNIENADTTDDGLNIIYDNIQGSDVYDLYNNCTNDIMAQNNDWQVYDSVSIEQHIFHKVDDPAHGLVNFIPFSNGSPVNIKTNDNQLPDEFLLYQNYPNPFNPETSIQYAVSSLPDGKAGRQFVSLNVYDILGKEVATLVNEEKPTGEYEVEFNASKLPSGIYFYQLKAGNFVDTKKMLLLK
jgi:Right handed beta helix region/Secretion system C-terminal sorting domain